MQQHHRRQQEPKKNQTKKHKRCRVSLNSTLTREEVLSDQLTESADPDHQGLEPQTTGYQEARFTMSFFISELKLWLGLGLQSHTEFQPRFKLYSIFQAASTTRGKNAPTAMAHMEMHSTKMDSTTIVNDNSSKTKEWKGRSASPILKMIKSSCEA